MLLLKGEKLPFVHFLYRTQTKFNSSNQINQFNFYALFFCIILTVRVKHIFAYFAELLFAKAAKLGEEILIEAKTLKKGRTLAFLECEIKNQDFIHKI